MFKRKNQETRAAFEAKPEQLPEIRNWVESFCRNSAVPPQEISKILLAIEEACSNVIRHAYLLGPGEIKLKIFRKRNKISFSIKDSGKSFELGNAKRIDLKKYIQTERKGGLGLQLMRKIMDEVIYQLQNGENELLLTKTLSKSPLPEKVRPQRISLRTKLVLSFSLILLFCVGAFYFYFGNKIEKQTTQRVLNSNLELGQSVALNSKDYLLFKDDLSLAGLVLNAKKGKSEIAYLLITDWEGKIWASTENQTEVLSAYEPPSEIDPHSYSQPQKYWHQKLGNVYHITLPVTESENLLGSIHLGVLESKIKAQIQEGKQGLINTLCLILVFGFLAIYISSSWLVWPLRRFTKGIREAKNEDWEALLPVQKQDEIGELAQSFKEISQKFKESQKQLDQEKIKQELELAHHIQKVLLPQSVPQLPDFEISLIYQPAQEVGGDYFDFIWIDKENLGIVVADVSGKGVTASMYISMLRTSLRLVAPNEKDPKKVLVKVNQLIAEDLDKGHFVTVLYLILNIPQRMITFASAGHNPLILYSSAQDKFHFLNPKGIPLGLTLPEEVNFDQNLDAQSLSLQPQDWVFLYTDGITEAMNSQRQTFGKKRLLAAIAAIKEIPGKPSDNFSQKLLEILSRFTQGLPPTDDVTLVALKYAFPPEKELTLSKKADTGVKSGLNDIAP